MRERRADPAPRARAAAPAARLLPGRAARELWHLDMTSIWVAEHGWVLPDRDRSTAAPARSSAGTSSLRCRAKEAIALIERRVAERGDRARDADARAPTTARRSPPARSSSSSPGSASRIAAAATATPRARRSSSPGSPSSRNAAIWRTEFETLDEAREVIARLHRPLPPPAPLGPELPHAGRGPPDLGRCPGIPQTRGLNRQRRGEQATTPFARQTRRSRASRRRRSNSPRSRSWRPS